MTSAGGLRLGSYPTPIERISALALWMKRDDRLSSVYGGNKVRKLEHLLAAARREGKSRILTIGAAGSHQVVATAIFGARHGFEVAAVLVRQPDTSHARLNLRVALAQGLVPHRAPAWSLAPAVVAYHKRADTYFVPLGGSSPLGSLGFVDAASELAAQVARGEMPEPDVIVVALGSGGTAAGLAVGLERAELRTRVVGVAVSHPAIVLAAMTRRLAKTTAKLAGLSADRAARAARRIDVDGRWVGRGYGYHTRDGQAAIADASAVGVELDPTYTAKALACALARARGSGETVLYWHTLSAAPLEPLLGERGSEPLPPELARLFR